MVLTPEKQHELNARIMLAAIRGLCDGKIISCEEGRAAAGKIIRGLTGDFSSDIIYYDENHDMNKGKNI